MLEHPIFEIKSVTSASSGREAEERTAVPPASLMFSVREKVCLVYGRCVTPVGAAKAAP